MSGIEPETFHSAKHSACVFCAKRTRYHYATRPRLCWRFSRTGRAKLASGRSCLQLRPDLCCTGSLDLWFGHWCWSPSCFCLKSTVSSGYFYQRSFGFPETLDNQQPRYQVRVLTLVASSALSPTRTSCDISTSETNGSSTSHPVLYSLPCSSFPFATLGQVVVDSDRGSTGGGPETCS